MTQTTLNTIEAVQSIVDTMQKIEAEFFETQKEMNALNEIQNDLLHAFELNLTEKDHQSVVKALHDLRNKRREVKDKLILLAEAKDFVGANYKFMNEGLQVIKKMKHTEEKASARKYYVRNCEAMADVIDIKKYDKLGVFISNDTVNENDTVESAVDKFNRKWNVNNK